MTVVQRRVASNMATGDLSSVTARRAALSIEFPPAAVARSPSGQSTGTKIVCRGPWPDDLVMWPLPVVSSTNTISPAPMWRVSPSLAVIEMPPARLITYCRRGARCQLFS
jgi:hypothetical protein